MILCRGFQAYTGCDTRHDIRVCQTDLVQVCVVEKLSIFTVLFWYNRSLHQSFPVWPPSSSHTSVVTSFTSTPSHSASQSISPFPYLFPSFSPCLYWSLSLPPPLKFLSTIPPPFPVSTYMHVTTTYDCRQSQTRDRGSGLKRNIWKPDYVTTWRLPNRRCGDLMKMFIHPPPLLHGIQTSHFTFSYRLKRPREEFLPEIYQAPHQQPLLSKYLQNKHTTTYRHIPSATPTATTIKIPAK